MSSFNTNKVRSRAIYDALRQSVKSSETQEQFVQRVLGALRKPASTPMRRISICRVHHDERQNAVRAGSRPGA